MDQLKLGCIGLFILGIIALSGCSGGGRGTLISDNTYSIHAHGGILASADDAFVEVAKKKCPNGFKIIERHKDARTGKVEGSVGRIRGT